MDPFKRILVALDLTEMDETLVQYVTRLSNYIDLEKIYFFNVMKSLEVPEEILKKYPDVVAPMDESTKREIQFTVDEVSKGNLKAEYEIKVTDGHRAEKIIKWAKVKEVDFIIMGRKSGLEGDGIISGKVLKLAPCSVIFIPEVLPETMQKVVVPIDFSKASERAFEEALFFASNNLSLEILALNIFEVPSGYHYSGKSHDEFAEVMRQHSQEAYEKLIQKYDTSGLKISPFFELNHGNDIAKKIYQFAIKARASGIMIGSKGRTQAAAILIGSIAEKLIRLNASLPTVVVKERRHNLHFLEALFDV